MKTRNGVIITNICAYYVQIGDKITRKVLIFFKKFILRRQIIRTSDVTVDHIWECTVRKRITVERSP